MAEDKTENVDIITGNPKRAILKIAFPMMFSMLILMIYNLVDNIWVAGLGANALAGIGFITPLYLILVGVANGLATGANSLIARNIGAKDYAQANNSALHSLLIGTIVSVIITSVMLYFLAPVLQVFGAGDAIGYAMDYGYVLCGFLIIFIFEEIESAIFRSEGDVRRATVVMALTAVVNMVLDPVFIYVWGMGIAGAAWSTVFSSALACVIMGYWIWVKRDLYLDLSLKNFKYQLHIMTEILYVAIPSSMDNFLFSMLAIVINGLIALVAGSAAVGIYTVSMKIVQFAILPCFAIGSAVLTVAGVAYGAKNYENLKMALSYSIKISLAVSVILVIVIFFLAPQISLLFSYTEASSNLAPKIASALSIICFYIITVPLGVMSTMIFQGVGKGLNALIITLLQSVVFGSLFAYMFCFLFGWGLNGIYLGEMFGSFVGGVIGYIWVKYFIKRFTKDALKNNASENA